MALGGKSQSFGGTIDSTTFRLTRSSSTTKCIYITYAIFSLMTVPACRRPEPKTNTLSTCNFPPPPLPQQLIYRIQDYPSHPVITPSLPYPHVSDNILGAPRTPLNFRPSPDHLRRRKADPASHAEPMACQRSPSVEARRESHPPGDIVKSPPTSPIVRTAAAGACERACVC